MDNRGYTYIAMIVVLVFFISTAGVMIWYSNFSTVSKDDDLTPAKILDYTRSLKDKSDDREKLLQDEINLIDDVLSGNYGCVPLFPVEIGPELTASELYAEECDAAITKKECERIDVYDSRFETFGDQDGTRDCNWVAIP